MFDSAGRKARVLKLPRMQRSERRATWRNTRRLRALGGAKSPARWVFRTTHVAWPETCGLGRRAAQVLGRSVRGGGQLLFRPTPLAEGGDLFGVGLQRRERGQKRP